MATKHPTTPHPAPEHESAMDYAQHEATYSGFVAGLKYVIASMAILMVGLYFAIIANQAGVGWVLIIASLIVPVVWAILDRR
jgi:hypothetical protein